MHTMHMHGTGATNRRKNCHMFSLLTRKRNLDFFTAREQEIDFVPLVISLIVYVTLLVAALRVLTSRIE